MWAEFVAGSRSCSEGFSPSSPVFLPPQNPTLLNSNSIGNTTRATGLLVARIVCVALVKERKFIFYPPFWESMDTVFCKPLFSSM